MEHVQNKLSFLRCSTFDVKLLIIKLIVTWINALIKKYKYMHMTPPTQNRNPQTQPGKTQSEEVLDIRSNNNRK